MKRLKVVSQSRGSAIVIIMAFIAGVMAMTLGSLHVFIVNRARWQTRIRDAYRTAQVMEAIGKYIKEASDKYEACNATAPGACDANCNAAGLNVPTTTTAANGGVNPVRRFCFVRNPNCVGVQNSDGVGIQYLDGTAVNAQQNFCLFNSALPTNTAPNDGLQFNSAQNGSIKPIEEAGITHFTVVEVPSRGVRETSRVAHWQNRMQRFFERWGGSSDDRFFQTLRDGPRARRTVTNWTEQAEAFIRTSLYDGPAPNNPVLVRGTDLSALATCPATPDGLIRENCVRRCLPNRPCVTFTICPAFVQGCGMNGLGAGPADPAFLVTGTIMLMGIQPSP